MAFPNGDDSSNQPETIASLTGLTGPSHLSANDERVILALFHLCRQLNSRLTRLEQRMDETQQEAYAQPDQEDILDLRLHSARLAAELSRVTVELRSEISELATSIGSTPRRPTLVLETDEHSMVDLTERSKPRKTSGWRPAE